MTEIHTSLDKGGRFGFGKRGKAAICIRYRCKVEPGQTRLFDNQESGKGPYCEPCARQILNQTTEFAAINAVLFAKLDSILDQVKELRNRLETTATEKPTSDESIDMSPPRGADVVNLQDRFQEGRLKG